MQMKTGKYAHASYIDDVEETERKSRQHGPPQIAIDPLIERRIEAEMAFDPVQFVEEMRTESASLRLVFPECNFDLGFGGGLVDDLGGHRRQPMSRRRISSRVTPASQGSDR